MTRKEHLLTILAEECVEVAKRATKALRFGLDETQPGQGLTNIQRIMYEMGDLMAVYGMLGEEAEFPDIDMHAAIEAKQAKVEHFLKYSAELGTLS